MPAAAAAFAAGEMDVVQLFEPHADRLVEAGVGHVWHRFSTRGDIGYTTLVATRAALAGRREGLRALVRGMARAQAAFAQAPLPDILRALQPFFPEEAPGTMTRVVSAYRAAGLWPDRPDLPVSAFVRLKAALLSGGLIGRDIPYDAVVEPALSTADPR